MDANNQIFVTSINKAIEKAKTVGTLDVRMARLYHVFTEYLEWQKALRDAGSTDNNENITHLQEKLMLLKRRYHKEICSYKTIIGICGNVPNIYPSEVSTSEYTAANTAPSVTGATIALVNEMSYTFSEADFTQNYVDAEGDPADKVIIYPAGLLGTLTFDGSVVTWILEFSIKDAFKLKYARASEESLNTTFKFRVSDYSRGSKYSDLTTNTITGTVNNTGITTIGDNTITVDPGVTTVLTLAMFTTDTILPYSDTEGDQLDAIRVDRIHKTNFGVFKVSGIDITEGQIISREQIIAEQFTHVSVNPEDVKTDGFEFSARDEGSMIWVK